MNNVVRFPDPGKDPRPRERAINLPPATAALVALIVLPQIILTAFIAPPERYDLFMTLGFVPATFTADTSLPWIALLTPVTYMALHGGWAHVGINSLMLTAFGTGAERMIGARRMLLLFVLCGMAAAAAQFVADPHSTDPVIGASGGISGLFGATFLLLRQQQGQNSWRQMLPLILLWMGISVLFGIMGAPGGEPVAWVAHIGGFLAGLVLLRPVTRLPL